MNDNSNIGRLTNYEQKCSNSINYSSFKTSSSPLSFPDLMENGIIVKYDTLLFSTDILEEKTISAEK
ncbi:hypothetical protein [Sunxiuqinia dokdonensis]|uniref:hypothetical protein n=1 Tax=Sunxiuqinia dokdonensis TaxID=1409788 RepID=UPI0012F73C28|nr:hypothetical protein [Sunxiuqinia dokdonensis]